MWDFNFNTPDRTPPRQQEDKFMNILPSLLNHPETFMAASGEYTIDCDSYFQEDLPFFFFQFLHSLWQEGWTSHNYHTSISS